MDEESCAQFEETAQQAAVDESGERDAWQLLDKADCVQQTEAEQNQWLEEHGNTLFDGLSSEEQ